MMCKLETISAYYDGLLDAESRRLVAEHLAACRHCAAALAAYRQISRDLQSLPFLSVPSSLDSAVFARLDKATPPRRSWRPALSALTAIALLVLVSGALMLRSLSPLEVADYSVLASSPLDHAVDVPVDAAVAIDFTAPVDRRTVQEQTRIEPPADVEYSWRDHEMIIRPKGELKPDTDYRIVIVPSQPAGAQASSGAKAMTAQPTAVIVFRTGSDTAAVAASRPKPASEPTPRSADAVAVAAAKPNAVVSPPAARQDVPPAPARSSPGRATPAAPAVAQNESPRPSKAATASPEASTKPESARGTDDESAVSRPAAAPVLPPMAIVSATAAAPAPVERPATVSPVAGAAAPLPPSTPTADDRAGVAWAASPEAPSILPSPAVPVPALPLTAQLAVSNRISVTQSHAECIEPVGPNVRHAYENRRERQALGCAISVERPVSITEQAADRSRTLHVAGERSFTLFTDNRAWAPLGPSAAVGLYPAQGEPPPFDRAISPTVAPIEVKMTPIAARERTYKGFVQSFRNGFMVISDRGEALVVYHDGTWVSLPEPTPTPTPTLATKTLLN